MNNHGRDNVATELQQAVLLIILFKLSNSPCRGQEFHQLLVKLLSAFVSSLIIKNIKLKQIPKVPGSQGDRIELCKPRKSSNEEERRHGGDPHYLCYTTDPTAHHSLPVTTPSPLHTKYPLAQHNIEIVRDS